MFESDIELWFKCNKERNDDTNTVKNDAPSGHNQKTDELTGKIIDFSTFIKSKLSAPEVLNVYNKNIKRGFNLDGRRSKEFMPLTLSK